jgi:16S rRNA (adenine1518-N6/adenine1519-N6)-dimethyltransferase
MTERPKLTRPSEVRAWIESRQFLPSKLLGQNFLIDENILRIMVDAGEISPEDGVMEVGPGLGILTEPLMERAGRLVAVEKDKRLAAHLGEAFGSRENFTLITSDALDVSIGEIKQQHRLNIFISNLPYSVGSRILVECFKLADGFDRLVVTVQLEVAERLAALPNTSDFGLLSIWAHLDYDVKIAKRVAHSCFYPRPQVTSAIVVMQRTRRRRAAIARPDLFDALIKHTFSHRRKQLGTTMQRFSFAGIKDDPAGAPARVGIDPTRRPETLTVDEWLLLTNEL